MAKGSAAEGQSGPESNGIGGIRGHRGDAGKQQGRKRNKTSAAGHGVQRASKQGRKKQHNTAVRIKVDGAQA
jgi:hypothetical protein